MNRRTGLAIVGVFAMAMTARCNADEKDANSQNKISIDEYFQQADRDNNGKLDANEIPLHVIKRRCRIHRQRGVDEGVRS